MGLFWLDFIGENFVKVCYFFGDMGFEGDFEFDLDFSFINWFKWFLKYYSFILSC